MQDKIDNIKNKFTKAIAQKELLEQQLENQIERKKNLGNFILGGT